MKPARARPRALTPIAALVLVAMLLALPLTLGSRGNGLGVVTAIVNAAGQQRFSLTEPISLSPSAGLWLRQGKVEARSTLTADRAAGFGKPASVAPTRLQIDDAVIAIVAPAAAPVAGDGRPAHMPSDSAGAFDRLVEVLASWSFEAVAVRNGRLVHEPSGGGAERELGRLNFTATRASRTDVVITGTLVRMDVAVTFDVRAGVPAGRKAAARVPLQASLKCALFTANVSGVVVKGAGLQLAAERAAIATPDLRAVARWLGIAAGPGSGFKSFSARGSIDWTGSRIDLQPAELVLDGNSAQGSVSAEFGSDRPRLEGTLAFNSLDLASYLGNAEAAGWSLLSAAASVFGAPQGTYAPSLATSLDADFRISADRVTIAHEDIGKAAASISLNDGRLNASVTEVELYEGGAATAQLAVDVRGPSPHFDMSGDFKGVNLQHALALIGERPQLKGRANIAGNVSMAGSTTAELLSSVEGRIDLTAPGGVIVGIDTAGLMSAGQKPVSTVAGWGALLERSTSGQSLDLRLTAAGGVVSTEHAELQTLANRYTAAGSVDLGGRSLDLTVYRWPVPVGQDEMGPYQIESVRLQGPLSAPELGAAPNGGRADAGRSFQQPPG